MAELAQIEDVMHVMGLTDAPKTRGRKPSGYRPIKTMQEAIDFVVRQLSQQDVKVEQDDEKIKRETP